MSFFIPVLILAYRHAPQTAAGLYPSGGLGWQNIRWMFTTLHIGHYQPLAWLTLGFDYTLWGMEPFGYHLTNLAIHALNAVLVYWLGIRLMSPELSGVSGKDTWLLFAAGFFAAAQSPL